MAQIAMFALKYEKDPCAPSNMQLETENFNPHSQQLSFTALNGA
jgi:hypothetical protein